MENEARIDLLARVARSLPRGDVLGNAGASTSILSLAAASYGSRPSGDATVPTGFDPVAVALFEALVEGAYLVATADGVFDDQERWVFERVITASCGGAVDSRQIAALVSDLGEQLAEDGLERRIEAMARSVTRAEHAREVLRVAALIAHASDDVSPAERAVLSQIGARCGLAPGDVDAALAAAHSVLAGIPR
jgi:tellurite resistance protein